MKNIEILELLNAGKYDELKALIELEVYRDSLNEKPDVKKRFSAMKRFLTTYTEKYTNMRKPFCFKVPEGFGRDDNMVDAFVHNYGCVITKESYVGEHNKSDFTEGADISKIVSTYISTMGEGKKVKLHEAFAISKSKGYKLLKSQVEWNYSKMDEFFIFRYKDATFKTGLIDLFYSIINDGENPTIYKGESNRSPLIIRTSIGVAFIMPILLERLNYHKFKVIDLEEVVEDGE